MLFDLLLDHPKAQYRAGSFVQAKSSYTSWMIAGRIEEPVDEGLVNDKILLLIKICIGMFSSIM